MKHIWFTVAILITAHGQAHAWKRTAHLISVPFIEATGIYADVKALQSADRTATKAAAVTNLGLVATQATLGSIILFGPDDLPPAIRIAHRIVGASIIASGIWMSIAGTLDDGVDDTGKYMAYTHTGLATIPLIIFSF